MTSLLASAFVKSVVALNLLLTPVSVPLTEKPTAPESFEASAYVNKDRKIRLSIDKSASERMTVNLRRVGQSTALFTEHVGRKVSRTRLVLDVEQLADGAYELELKTPTGRLTRYIDLTTPAEPVVPQRLLTIQ